MGKFMNSEDPDEMLHNTAFHLGLHCLFVLLLMSQVNSYGHGGTVSSPYHTFFWASPYHTFLGKLEQAVNQYFVHILSLVTDNNPS